MNNKDINLLVHKKVTNQISREESLQLEQMISSDLVIKSEAEKIASTWDSALSLGDDVQFDSKKAFSKFLIQTQEVRQNVHVKETKILTLRRIMAVAAVFALAFFAFNFLAKTSDTLIESGSNAMTAYLPEGSEIKLGPNSSISYNKTGFNTERKITLKGSGIIHVSKVGVPFIVQGNDFEVEVMGTTFFVESDGSKENVRVLEGKVEVRNASSKVQITDKQGVTIEKKQLIKSDNVNFSDLGWQNDKMEYNNTPLSKVLADIESKFSVSISVKSTDAIRNCTFTSGSLVKLPLDQIISIMESTYSTKFFKKSASEYTLGSINCR